MPSRPPVHRAPRSATRQQQRRSTDARRYRENGELRRWYMRAAWRKRVRPDHLSSEPLCRICRVVFDRVELATDVHHTEPPTSWEKFLAGPFASLCADHHREITAAISHGRRPFHLMRNADGQPVAPLHDALWRELGAPTP
ncbi:hypothetical protein T8K17_18035 [Thalassobaculum sp. OXR-137]|uniref:hypothetical protein n=1 Tax=Thalassobaculum sp. OXR-137 TaxID=3100173 RepID=UPI002AC994D0|nr:hypothetical protein [Thalassobaculum sp. OXR-137]WPZ33131.1 hypothetical protein T8K17_18035 [Thalassobaculum sp. OXR-137]